MKTKDTWKKLGEEIAKADFDRADNEWSPWTLMDWAKSIQARARALRSADRKRTKLTQFLVGKRSSRGLEKVIREDKRKGASRG